MSKPDVMGVAMLLAVNNAICFGIGLLVSGFLFP